MIDPKAPGIYLREADVTPPAGLPPMHITGFVGQAERGPLNYPQPLTNWGQFRDVFGDFMGYSYLAYAVFGFFLNGGSRCYVVRVASEQATRARAILDDANDDPVIIVEAINEGAWGNSVQVRLEGKSTDDLALTTLVTDAAEGTCEATFGSVIGLARDDRVRLVHPRKPLQEQLVIKSVERITRKVTFASPVTTPGGFAAGTTVMAPGFKLTFEQQDGIKLVRQEVFDNLAMDPAHPRYFAALINGDPEEQDYVRRAKAGLSLLVRARISGERPARPHAGPNPAPLTGGSDGSLYLGTPDKALPPGQLRDGYSYYTGYRDGEPFGPTPPSTDPDTIRAFKDQRFGMAAFETVGEIGLVAIPDLVIPDLYAAIPRQQIPKGGILFANLPAQLDLSNLRQGQEEMLNHCQLMRERFAILDSPPGAAMKWGSNPIERWPDFLRSLPAACYGALYYPWVREKAADFGGANLLVPPSGHVAGIYARTEIQRGAGKAPANELVQGVVALEFAVGDSDQGVLNERSVNCLRAFTTRGIRVWGARTLSTDPAWRYVNVRRVALLILKTILVGLAWTVFEPNDAGLRNRIAGALNLVLRDLFQRGALLGSTPAEAYYVRCDENNNPQEAIDRGEIVAEVGFALARPAEFIVVTVRRTAEAVSVSEPV